MHQEVMFYPPINKNKMNKKLTLIFGIFFLVLTLAFISAESVSTFCAEKTTLDSANAGTWCQPVVKQTDCNSSFHCASTGCENTSYCKSGTCVKISEGTCAENSAKIICENDGGVHYNEPIGELPQCDKGCCFFGKSTEFMTGIACSKLESTEGFETTFNPSMTDYFECINAGNPDVLGACTFTEDYQKDCRMLTKEACRDLKSSKPDADFNEGYLCTAPLLLTKCVPTQNTWMEEGGDDKIYFLDSCENKANIYDYDAGWNEDTETWKMNYWTEIIKPENSCIVDLDPNSGNQLTCGNCEYDASGSTGALYERGKAGFPDKGPLFGDYICKDLNCPWINKNHGETWCISNRIEGAPVNSPGSTSAVQKCYNGEVTIEDICEDYRQELCIENEVELDRTLGDTFREMLNLPTNINTDVYAGCVENRRGDCIEQTNKDSCKNEDKRDCDWIEVESDTDSFFIWEGDMPTGDKFVDPSSIDAEYVQGYCVPKDPPGSNFWDVSEGDVCGNVKVGAFGWWKKGNFKRGYPHYKKNPSIDSHLDLYVSDDFKQKMENICSAVGDCEVKYNYLNMEGTDNSKTDYKVMWWTDAKTEVGEFFSGSGSHLKELKELTLITCQPWDPPHGGKDCEKCNNQVLPCTEYQCRALGGRCEFENDYCYDKNPQDVNPPKITLLPEYLTDGFEFDNEDLEFPAGGNAVEIMHKANDDCVPANKRFSFKIHTDRLATCKFNTVRTDSFEEMGNNWFDDSSGNRYNHTITLFPLGKMEEEQLYGLEVDPNREYNLFVRCENMGNGRPNVEELVFKFCVEDIPDPFAPIILESETTTQNGASIGNGVENINVTFYLDEVADCKWDRLKRNYEDMENEMFDCGSNTNHENIKVNGECTANFTGLISNSNTDQNDFFIRCRDRSPNENTHTESIPYTLYGSIPLTILSSYTQPSGILAGSSDSIEFEFNVKTAAGSENGFAKCYYRKNTSSISDQTLFSETGEVFHKQPYWRPVGSYNYTIECFDSAGNMVTEQIIFTIEKDDQKPIVVRAFKRDNLMELTTNEPAKCAYSTEDCNFNFDDEDIINISTTYETTHKLIWDPEIDLYVKCKDEYNNYPSEGYSITLRASDYFG